MGKQKKRIRKYAHKPHKAAKVAKVKAPVQQESRPVVEDEAKNDEMVAHKKALEKLSETQADFLEFLAKEDADLLNFGEESESEEEEADDVPEKQVPILSFDILSKWEHDASTSLVALTQLAKAFKVATHINTTDENSKIKFKYAVDDAAVFNEIITFSVKELGPLFVKHLEAGSKQKKAEPSKNLISKQYPSTWPSVAKLVRGYLQSLLHFLDTLVEENMLSFVLKQTEKIIQLLGPFAKLTKAFLKKFLNLWGSSTEKVRVRAFLNIRMMALQLPYPQINNCLKGIYLTFVKNAKFSNHKTQPLINFMSNCVVELCGIDFSATYQHAFVYIRQISVHLRSTLSSTSSSGSNKGVNKNRKPKNAEVEEKKSAAKRQKDYESIYNWQVLNSIHLWIKVLCAYPHNDQLWLLAYPLVQLLHAIITLIPTPRYYPLRCQCVHYLNLLAQAKITPNTTNNTAVLTSNTTTKPLSSPPNFFINVAGYLIEMLDYFTEFFKKDSKFRPFTGKPPSVQNFMLKTPDKLLGTKPFTEGILNWIHDLLLGYVSTYHGSIAFPELVLPLTIHTRSFVKNAFSKRASMTPNVTNRLKSLLHAIQQHSAVISSMRGLVNNFGPCNTAQVQSFLQQASNKTLQKGNSVLPLEKYAKEFALSRPNFDEKPTQKGKISPKDHTEKEEDEDLVEGDESVDEMDDGDEEMDGEGEVTDFDVGTF